MISLKAYNREIEQLIDNGLYDEAIAHCIQILSTYPKCIDSYRNLGKALLELKKYPEAQDVFSRVLSAIPDDFISHVGLSIIFEDQNNLDLAIWHMEQAFDVQPSNLAIQDELKRLFGRRDGELPTKIRLTRGALVRMYARGELFQQAITEIQSILQEDPQRIDLEVILARMYYFSGNLEESESVCNQIIEKIPFCFEANRILQQLYLNNNANEQAVINKNRLISLDPYYQYLPSPFSEQEVPENKVLLEKLEYIPSISSNPKIPTWLEEIDTSTSDKPGESFAWLVNNNNPDILNSKSTTTPFSTSESVASNLENSLIQSEDDIPDWLKNAGVEDSLDFLSNDENVNQDESNSVLDKTSITELPGELPLEQQTENTPKPTTEDLASLFTELKEGIMDNDNLSAKGNENKQFPPSDWMSQFSDSEGISSSDSADQDFPDWLKNFQEEEPQISQNSDEIPDWLKNLHTEVEPTTPSSVEDHTSSDENDDNSSETISNQVFQVEKISDESSSNETYLDNIFDHEESKDATAKEIDSDGWEQVDLTTSETNNTPLETVPEPQDSDYVSSDDRIPDWVKSVLLDQKSDDQTAIPQDSSLSSELSENATLDGSIESETEHFDTASSDVQSDTGIISQQTNDELLDWLRGLKSEEESVEQKEIENNSIESSFDSEKEAIDDVISHNATDEVQSLVVDETNGANQEEITQPENTFEESSSDLDSLSALFSDNEQINEPDTVISNVINENNVLQSQFVDENRIQTSELNIENFANIVAENSFEEIDQLLITGDFENLAKTVSQNIENGESFDQIIHTLTAKSDEHKNDFAYWQFLGDVYSKNNHLNDAFLAYQKAEDILVKTIST